MNIFSIGKGTKFELTRENFIEKTHKNFPFYQDPKKYGAPYFAICPECNNTIQIINLFGSQYQEEITGNTSMHGRHFLHKVDGLPDYDKDRYENCPLHNPVAFKINIIRDNEVINEKIRELVENNRNKIISNIREITDILFKNDNFYKIINNYISAKSYCYKHTNIYNIPYSILYTSKSISLFGQRIGETELGQNIANSIVKSSQYFKVDKGRRILKKVDEYVFLYLLVSNHRINGSRQYMKFTIEEKCRDNTQIIFQKEIEIKQFIY